MFSKNAFRECTISYSDCAAEVSDFSILPCEAGEPEAQLVYVKHMSTFHTLKSGTGRVLSRIDSRNLSSW